MSILRFLAVGKACSCSALLRVSMAPAFVGALFVGTPPFVNSPQVGKCLPVGLYWAALIFIFSEIKNANSIACS